MKKITSTTFNRLKKKQRVLFFGEMAIGSLTPHQAYNALRSKGDFSVIFEVLEEEAKEAYSFIGTDPLATFESLDRKTQVTSQGKTELWKGKPYTLLRKFIKKFTPATSARPPFKCDALFGFCSYDSLRLKTKIPDRHPNQNNIPDLYFHFFKTVVVFDHKRKKLYIALNIDPKETNYELAGKRLDETLKSIKAKFSEHKLIERKEKIEISEEMSDQEYMKKVKKAQEHIKAGEITQIVISRTFKAPYQESPFKLYCTLQKINPSPYSYLFESERFSMLGESPEKLVSVHKGILETVPVGGTHPRDPVKGDAVVAKMLLSNKKEVDEHMLKMEGGFEDLARISKPGSVKIVELRGTRVFSHVIHIITRIKGKIKEGLDCFDAIQGILPAVTLSGTPKKRAMELIDGFEKSRRGIYGGAICLVSSQCNLDSCIPIRSIFIKDGFAYARAGAGIVAPSIPEYEAKETRHKSSASLKALTYK